MKSIAQKTKSKKQSKMDFVLNDSPLYGDKILFRFFPAKSNVHGFGDEPPKNRDEIYKVYYSWQILIGFEREEGSGTEKKFKGKTTYKKVFDMPFDENSLLTELPHYIEEAISQKKNFSFSVFGDGADWEISYRKRIKSTGQKEDLIDFRIWSTVTHVGYRFSLFLSEAIDFKEFLDNVNQYMLEHGEGM